jgi:ankyrin repeat protein
MANGATPLYVASENGHEGIVSVLLNNDADVNICRSKGSTPLFVACMEGHELVVKLLLNNYANVNQKHSPWFG